MVGTKNNGFNHHLLFQRQQIPAFAYLFMYDHRAWLIAAYFVRKSEQQAHANICHLRQRAVLLLCTALLPNQGLQSYFVLCYGLHQQGHCLGQRILICAANFWLQPAGRLCGLVLRCCGALPALPMVF